MEKGHTDFNSDNNQSLFTEEENTHVYILLKQRYENELSCLSYVESFFKKSWETFRELMISVGLKSHYSKIKSTFTDNMFRKI